MSWTPNISAEARQGRAVYETLLDALVADVKRGELTSGDPLPTQRSLAATLGISVGTVGRFYRKAEQMGLIDGLVGSGTRVSNSSAMVRSSIEKKSESDLRREMSHSSQVVDLSRNEPSPELSAKALEEAVTSTDFAQRLQSETGYAPAAGRLTHRRLFAEWLVRNGINADWNSTIVCHGAHHGLSLALQATHAESQTVFVESNTYFGFLSIARSLGVNLVPIDTDADGPRLEHLDRMAEKHKNACLYLMPSLQNPTLRAMPMSRRQEIVASARKHNFHIIEDEVYRPLAPKKLEPFLHLAPERTFHIASLSKAVAPALRAGCLVVEDATLLDRVVRTLSDNSISGTSTSMTLTAAMLDAGLVDASRDRVVEDSIRPGAHHIWVPMKLARAEAISVEAMHSSIALTSPSTLSFDGDNAGLRICFGSCQTIDLQSSISTLRAILN